MWQLRASLARPLLRAGRCASWVQRGECRPVALSWPAASCLVRTFSQFGQPEQGAPAATNLQEDRWLPGDWICLDCKGHNFAKSMRCRSCGAAKFSSQSQDSGALPAGWQVAHDPNGTPYYYNEKDPAGTTTWQRPQSNPADASSVIMEAFKKSSRPGDWLCGSCQTHNFSSRSLCKTCEAPRTADSISAEGRPGDWMCGQCRHYNFANRQSCGKCAAQRPESS
eukprot:gb/GFBE01035896.1/.p1 GENE.gb/GFBE01035896.1/~~gb/GFBE01035896.1/.p1  ORF type:complete len:224 (+),score=25.12 gb/GFBE01035896.1/:1-672(+)